MSLKSWKAEFYPITAKQASRKSLVGAVEHSLQKWQGLLTKNRMKYDVFASIWRSAIFDSDGEFTIDADTCSLCEKFLLKTGNCVGCPLYESRGQVRCDDELDDEDDSPYHAWSLDSNPKPMIVALRKALKWAKANS